MRNILVIFLFLCLCVFIGCLGVGGGGGSLGGGGSPYTSALLSGRVYFADRQLYGGIPVAAYDLSGKRVETVLTDSAGYFAFTSLAAGAYSLAAITGDSEVIFARSVQVDGVSSKQVDTTSLLSITEVVIDNISSTSFHLKFKANRASRASVEYGILGGYQQTVTIGQAGFTTHEITISGLRPLNDYEATIYLTGDDGQDFVMRGLYVATIGAAGPTNLSVAINEGDYETKTQNVTLYLKADNCTHMRISENVDMSDAAWVTYSQTYSYAFKSTSAGTRRLYVEFRDSGGVISPVQSDAILMTKTGYVGVWINGGEATTSKTETLLSVVFPGATQMQLANNSDFLNSFWEIYTDSKKWTFTTGDGLKTIYCRFRGGNANPDEVFMASILLDTTPPAVEMKIDNESKVTATTSVTINFDFSVPPTQMKISNTAAPASSAAWIAFSDTAKWVIPTGDGEKEIFAQFRDGAGNQYGPISAKITLDTVAPLGNTIALQLTEDSASEVATFALAASLPIFLHFDIADTTTYKAQYAITEATTTPPVSFKTVGEPFTPVQLEASELPVGIHKVWARFSDLAGNLGYFQTTNVKIDGPQIIIAPKTATLKSGQTEQFSATIKNIEGTVSWSLSPADPASVHGSITSNGLFTAPNPITVSTTTIVMAQLLGNPSVKDQAVVNLQTQVEIYVNETSHQVSLNFSKEVMVRFRNSTNGGIVSTPGAGTATISSSIAGDPVTDQIATIKYTAPSAIPTTNPVSVTVSSLEDPTKEETLLFYINAGPWVSVSPATTSARLRTGVTNFAATCSSATANLTWSLPDSGFFDAAKTLTTIVTPPSNHSVLVYAPNTQLVSPIRLIASFTEAAIDYSSVAQISLTSPVTLTLSPKLDVLNLDSLSGLTFQATVENATTTQVLWQFKNSNDGASSWVNADLPVNNNGSLRISEKNAIYFPPTVFPVPPATYTINIRATSIDDSVASAVATISLIAPINVTIHEGFSALASDVTITEANPNASVTVTLEVGSRQFFANINNATAGTNLTASWFVQGIANGNTSFGTVDSTGKYFAPDTAVQSSVTLRGVSNANTAKFGETKINLEDFWQLRANGLTNVTNAVNSVYCLAIDSTTAAANPRILYVGTNGNGAYRTTIAPSDSDYDWSNISWTGITGLSTPLIGQGGKYTINRLTMSLQNSDRVVAATNDGLYLISGVGAAATVEPITVPNSRNAITGPGATTTTYSSNFTRVFSDAIIDPNNDDFMYALGKDQGVVRFIWNGTNYVYDGTLYDDNQSYSVVRYYDYPWSVNTGTIASPTIVSGTAQRPERVQTASGSMEFNCITMNSQNPNVLYVGFTKYLESRNPDVFRSGYLKLSNIRTADYLYIGQASFNVTGGPPAPFALTNPETVNDWHFVGAGGVIHWDDTGVIHAIAVDPNTQTTLWKGKDSGVFRSTDDGETFAQSGTFVNVRGIFIDPINTVNVYVGTETGLHRSKDAGGVWKQIQTGLEGNTTINTLGLTPGGLGTRRIFSGTTNGVFMGRTSLDLD
ncbi:MAG: hypothetical protein CVV41_05335 [Candidatus Riflebacteria bacterium HGW-Riflebacteria-1]|jgi:hypothetical protein|nr:MAG: hypothetical protein CVV41_05335 [Candidatus Riflebacteria bacterium HGW-Riflebacteria-1]